MPVTTIQEARPRVQRMLDHGYEFEQIEGEIASIDGLDFEEQSALWVWAWTFDDLGRPASPLARPDLAG